MSQGYARTLGDILHSDLPFPPHPALVALQDQIRSTSWPAEVTVNANDTYKVTLGARPQEWTLWPRDKAESTKLATSLLASGMKCETQHHPSDSVQDNLSRVFEAFRTGRADPPIQADSDLHVGPIFAFSFANGDKSREHTGTFGDSEQSTNNMTILADVLSTEYGRDAMFTPISRDVDENWTSDTSEEAVQLGRILFLAQELSADPGKYKVSELLESASATEEVKSLHKKELQSRINKLSKSGEILSNWKISCKSLDELDGNISSALAAHLSTE